MAISFCVLSSALLAQRRAKIDSAFLIKGVPGPASTVIVRDSANVIDTTQTLFVIDGIPVEYFKVKTLDPNKIESISVLKDSSNILSCRGRRYIVVITHKCIAESIL